MLSGPVRSGPVYCAVGLVYYVFWSASLTKRDIALLGCWSDSFFLQLEAKRVILFHFFFSPMTLITPFFKKDNGSVFDDSRFLIGKQEKKRRREDEKKRRRVEEKKRTKKSNQEIKVKDIVFKNKEKHSSSIM